MRRIQPCHEETYLIIKIVYDLADKYSSRKLGVRELIGDQRKCGRKGELNLSSINPGTNQRGGAVK